MEGREQSNFQALYNREDDNDEEEEEDDDDDYDDDSDDDHSDYGGGGGGGGNANAAARRLQQNVLRSMKDANPNAAALGTARAFRCFINAERADGIAGLALFGNVEMQVKMTRSIEEIGQDAILLPGTTERRVSLSTFSANPRVASRRCSPWEFLDRELEQLKWSPCAFLRIFEETAKPDDSEFGNRRALVDVHVLEKLAMELELNVQTAQEAEVIKNIFTNESKTRRFVGRFCVLKRDPDAQVCRKDLNDLRRSVDQKLSVFGLVMSCPFRAASSACYGHENEIKLLSRVFPRTVFTGSFSEQPFALCGGVSGGIQSSYASSEAATCFAVISRKKNPSSKGTTSSRGDWKKRKAHAMLSGRKSAEDEKISKMSAANGGDATRANFNNDADGEQKQSKKSRRDIET